MSVAGRFEMVRLVGTAQEGGGGGRMRGVGVMEKVAGFL